MLEILENLQDFFSKGILKYGSEDDFPISFDIYINDKEKSHNRNLESRNILKLNHGQVVMDKEK